GVDGSAAFNLAEIEGSARRGRNFRIDEPYRTANQRVDRIGHAEIGPAVAAGTGDDHFHTARGQGSGGHVVDAGTVQYNDGANLRAIRVNEGPHATEIAFTFLADVCGKQDSALRLDFRNVESARHGEHASQTGTVVGNSGSEQAIAFARDINFRGRRENGVEVRR